MMNHNFVEIFCVFIEMIAPPAKWHKSSVNQHVKANRSISHHPFLYLLLKPVVSCVFKYDKKVSPTSAPPPPLPPLHQYKKCTSTEYFSGCVLATVLGFYVILIFRFFKDFDIGLCESRGFDWRHNQHNYLYSGSIQGY